MKIDLTKDEMICLYCCLSGNLRKLAANKRLANEQCGDEFDVMFESLMQGYRTLMGRILYMYALALQEDQER